MCDICHARVIGIIIYKSSKPEFLKVLITFCRGDNLCESTDCTHIHGVQDRVTDGCIANIFIIPVSDLFTVGIIVRLVFDRRGKGHATLVEGRSVSGYDLKAGSGLSWRVCRSVEGTARRFCSAAAHDRFDLAGVLIHNDNRGLGLQGNMKIFIHNITCFCVDTKCALIFLNRAVHGVL